MAIELSDLTFTEQDDVVPALGVEEILNTGIANTLAGNDIINGRNQDVSNNGYSFFNSGTLNTGEGNDILTGTLNDPEGDPFWRIGFNNAGTIDTGEGNDIITGIIEEINPVATYYGIYSVRGTFDTGNGNDIISGITQQGIGIFNWENIINTGDGDDTITGTILENKNFGTGIQLRSAAALDTGKGNDIVIGTGSNTGIANVESSFNTGEGNDIITGNSNGSGLGIVNIGSMDTGGGNDIITGNNLDETDGLYDNYGTGILNGVSPASMDTGDGNDTITGFSNVENGRGILNSNTINTGNDNDIISGIGDFYGIRNDGTINTGNGEDSIISKGKLGNYGGVFLGEGNDSIIIDANYPSYFYPPDEVSFVLENFNAIETGDGNDIITSTYAIYNEGVINTGNGDDSIIVDGGVDGPATGYGIYNNGGAINMGDGNDSIIANGGFESGLNSSGSVFLGEGDDYIKGFGSGDFYGGNGNDTLELTPGTYTVGIWGEGGESPIFTKGNQLMITSEFEKLKAGNTLYDFTSLTAGQIIIVA